MCIDLKRNGGKYFIGTASTIFGWRQMFDRKGSNYVIVILEEIIETLPIILLIKTH